MNWAWFWRGLGILAGFTMLAILGMVWITWRAKRLAPTANGAELPSGIDVISIQLDILSLIIAVVGVGLAVMSFLGYQSIKSWAEAAAIKAATAKADEVATAAIALHMQNMPGTDGGTQPPVEPGQVTELTEEEEGE